MRFLLHRGIIGLLAGLLSSIALSVTITPSWVGVLLGLLFGGCYSLFFRPTPRAYGDSLMVATGLGIVLWMLFTILLLPLLSGTPPQWTATEMRNHFPALIGWCIYGTGLGLLVQVGNDLSLRYLGTEVAQPVPQQATKTHVVILGGGFAGVTTAMQCEKLFAGDPSIELTVVSDTNALLFTPMLAEVAGGSLEATHISSPLRTSLHRTQIVKGQVQEICLEKKQVTLASHDQFSPEKTIRYDHLILALGSVSNYLGLKNIEQVAFDFKSLAHAIRIRNHVIDLLERADRETDEATRQKLLTFIIAGGGFAGVELAGSLNDFIRGSLIYYPTIHVQDIKVIVVHPRERILPELSASLAQYALERMQNRGVTFKLNTRVLDADSNLVRLNPSEELPSATLIWTAGVRPHPLVEKLSLEHNSRGAICVDKHLAVPGASQLWALGDCAAVIDAKTGQAVPPTAQFALREAKTLAQNIYASEHKQALKAFHFDALGTLCVVGYQTACAEIKGLCFSGFFAWLMWRGIYLAKLPGLERKLRVLSDWLIEIIFARDIVQTLDVDETYSPAKIQPSMDQPVQQAQLHPSSYPQE
ncbi:NAD(P)/FAD-dependent oxidoreductase [Tengunoibacter tsumagoiensis]|uniref:NADH:ubiquinone reductase (non-electrogenic) n=1 Tax=Tengunoibacter tsumagoiensis TaxID=2014871 RepID=A0A402AA09_9CHLR|nr:NAD(P)/FAD-dependent oxidoreductase [Tengunoibacter tsumagoiensis]GCE15866.1 hypothetical protein KTT_57250 [Tengunoibacter tsumagoiensis]